MFQKNSHLLFCSIFVITILAGCAPSSSAMPSETPTVEAVNIPVSSPVPSETLTIEAGNIPTTTPVHTEIPTVEAVNIPATYGHPEILTDTSWLYDHLDDPNVRIVDARNPLESEVYKTGHLPGAVYASVLSDICCPSAIMPAASFESAMSKLGIGDDTTVVIYDTDGGIWASRLWWALRYYGHDQAMILNGGLNRWVSNGNSLETDTPEVEPAVFHANVQKEWKAEIDEVRNAIEDPNVVLLDALSWPTYAGDTADYARPGHITSALSFPASDTINLIYKTILPPSDLAKMLMRLKLDPEQRTITYCGGGFAGAHVAYVLYLMGFEDVGLYDGSLMEWAEDPSNPMEVVP